MLIKIVYIFLTLFIFSGCQKGSDEIQHQRELDIDQEKEYDTRKTPLHPSDEIKR